MVGQEASKKKAEKEMNKRQAVTMNQNFYLATLDSVCRHVTMDANSSSNLFVSMWLRFLIVVHIDEYLNGLAKL
ncbi:hypothetical protein [Streptococcus pneumoniae]|uniref:hypothetical protein n=1 Tax=Streptococcus pneumoniae TaxID=1313 RepID=UPI0015D9DA6A|nr:hypothetical protein [Streptococcus pneumoniae]